MVCTVGTATPARMIAGAMVHARLARVVFGAEDPKGGGMISRYRIGTDGLLNHTLAFDGGLLAAESANMLRDFFRGRRKDNGGGRGR